jgi:hypothetical protein
MQGGIVMAGKKSTKEYEDIEASPVKSFFVNMLTRDIRLEEAILDLLDNCVDGILRNTKIKKTAAKPYDGFFAEIKFSKNDFSIFDNCGGIPPSELGYAFKMGRPKEREEGPAGGVGVYGIGMKRAIFKLGRHALISTQHHGDRREIEIQPDWLDDEANWSLHVNSGIKTKHDGTEIFVSKLHKGISEKFGADEADFQATLETMVSTHYAFIIDKGFEVKINGTSVVPFPTRFVFNKKPAGKTSAAIQPFIWTTKTSGGVEVFLTIGFTRPLPSAEEVESELEHTKRSTVNAGWTILCNDRAVVYCDRTELTGWGEAGVPRYHTQFIAISGIVEFKAANPALLPTTTTKRGIDASSRLYLQVKNKMREGMKIFTDYTNRWKGQEEEAKKFIEEDEPATFEDIKKQAKELPMTKTKKSVIAGSQFKPTLPAPAGKAPNAKVCRISFTKNKEDVAAVSNHLFDDASADPSVVGEKCFDIVRKEVGK